MRSMELLTISDVSVLGRTLGSFWGGSALLFPPPLLGTGYHSGSYVDPPLSGSSTFWNFTSHSRPDEKQPRCAVVKTAWKVEVRRSWTRSCLTRAYALDTSVWSQQGSLCPSFWTYGCIRDTVYFLGKQWILSTEPDLIVPHISCFLHSCSALPRAKET